MVSGVTKYGQNLDWHQKVSQVSYWSSSHECVHVHVHDVITACAWQHDNSEDISSILTQACWQGLLLLHIQDIPTPCMRCSRLSGPCQCRGNINNLLWSENWWVARSHSPAASLHPFHYRPNNTLASSPGLNYPFWPKLIVILPREAHASKWITDTLLRTDIGVGVGLVLGREELSKCRYKAGDWC